MKKELIVVILCFSSFCYSQTESRKAVNDTLVWTNMTCEKGSEEAEIDFEKGTYNSYFYGINAEIYPKAEEGFNEFYIEYVRKKYSISIEHRGCIVTDYSECYSKAMNKLIYKKFGINIFEKARKKALKLFNRK